MTPYEKARFNIGRMLERIGLDAMEEEVFADIVDAMALYVVEECQKAHVCGRNHAQEDTT